MEMSVKFILVFFIAGICGLQGGEFFSTSPPGCPLRPLIGLERRLEGLREDSSRCVFLTSQVDLVSVMESAHGDQILEVAVSYCQLRPLAVDCILMTNGFGALCLNTTDQQILERAGTFYLTIFDLFCSNNAQHFVELVNAIKQKSFEEEISRPMAIIEVCTTESTRRYGDDHPSQYRPSLYTKAEYAIMKAFKKCLKEHYKGNEAIVNAIEPVIQAYLDITTCVGRYGEPISCEAPAF